MLSVYFVRHGQTDYSRQNRFCGSTDAPLNDVGLRMAEALAARYADFGFDAIYSSPLRRTRETAEPVARPAGLDVIALDGLREIAYGEWEGRPERDVERDDHERFAAWAAHPARVAPPGGETATAIAARATDALDRIRAHHDRGKVLVVSHKATIRILLCTLLGVDVDHFRRRVAQRVAAVSCVDFKKDGPLLQMLNDVSHLDAELLEGDGT
jgi:broad specificity phosphatase PhoE